MPQQAQRDGQNEESSVLYDTTRVIDQNDDILGRVGFANSITKALSDLAKDEKRLPCSVALFGPWGGGKTTVILWAMESLSEKAKDVVVPLYVSVKTCGGNLLLGLLKALSREDKTKTDKVKEALKKVVRLLPALVGIFHSGLGHFLEKVMENSDEWQEKDPLKEFRKALSEMYGNKTPIIFLDDLDRLPPLHAVEVLEQIELLLGITPTTEDELREPEREKEPKRKEEPKHEEESESGKKHPKFILVVAVDPEILVMGLKSKYGERIFTDTHAHSYIAKHFQKRFTLQPPDLETAYEALTKLLNVPKNHLRPVLEPGQHILSHGKISDSDRGKYIARNIGTAEIAAIFENMRFCKQAAEFARDADYRQFRESASRLARPYSLKVKEEVIRLETQEAHAVVESSEGSKLAVFVSLALSGEPLGALDLDIDLPWLRIMPRVLVFLVQLLRLHAPDIARWFANCPRNFSAWEAIAFANHVWWAEPLSGPKALEWNALQLQDFRDCACFARLPIDQLRETIQKNETIRHIAGAINTVSRGSWELVRAALDTIAATIPKQKN